MFLISFFRAKLDTNKLKVYLENKPKWIAYLLAVCLGAITPFCSCSSIPLFIGFIEAGIPFGVVMAFLITSPMINEVAVPILWTNVGTVVTVTYVMTGMIVGVLGGLFMDKMGFKKHLQDHLINKEEKTVEESGSCSCSCSAKKEKTFTYEVKYAYNYTKDTIRTIFPYVIFGIGVGALIHGYVPEQFFINHVSKDNLFAVPMAVLLGIPLYTDAIGIIPVAQVLLEKSVPIGTVLAMMMSVVAISLPEMILLKKVFKTKLVIYFALTLLFMFIFVGYLYNLIF
jgi:hypothetical protein